MISVASYVFYLLVEEPAHMLVREIRLWPGRVSLPEDADEPPAEGIQPGQTV